MLKSITNNLNEQSRVNIEYIGAMKSVLKALPL